MLNARLPQKTKIRHIERCNKDTKSLIEEYKEKRRKEKSVHKRKKKEWMNVELENMELLRKQHEGRKFYKEING